MAEIVKLVSDDWKELRDLRIKATKEVPLAFGRTSAEETEKTEEQWRKQLAESRYYALKEEGTLIGMLCVALEKGSMQSHVANIFGVYVGPGARGKGLGRRLMEAAINDLKEDSHVMKVKLKVAETQKEAQALYEGMGFKKVGVFEKEGNFNGRYVDILVMEKFLR